MRRFFPGPFFLLLASLSFAQNSSEQKDAMTTFRSESRLVAIDVIATDKHGKVVTDLTAKDFQITQDRKLQNVKVFENVTNETRATIPSREELRLGPEIATNVPENPSKKPLTVFLLDIL